MLLLRKTTFELIAAIRGWQKGFTRLRRPQLMEKDYMITMITEIDFVNTIPMRKKFNFMIGRGNIFLLPIQASGRNLESVQCSPKLAKLIEKFANPDEDDLQKGYQALLNSLPPEHYRKVVGAERWIEATWKPDIIIKEIVKEDPLLKRLEEEERKRKEEEEEAKRKEIEESDLAPSAEEVEAEKKKKEENDKKAGAKGKGKDNSEEKKGDKDKDGKPKKKPKEPELTYEERRALEADEFGAKIMAEMNAPRKAENIGKPKGIPVTEKAAKLSFTTSRLRGMVDVADKRAKQEAEEAAAAAARKAKHGQYV